MALLYSNENFPKPVVEARARCADSPEAGKAEQAIPDEEVLAFAVSLQRALLTINRKDFIQFHRTTPSHAGIIVCTQDMDFIGQATRIDAEIRLHPSLAGKLLRINRPH